MKNISATDLSKLTPEEIVKYLSEGAKIVDATLPILKEVWIKIATFVTTIQTDKLSTPKGKRKAIEELQKDSDISKAKDVIIKAQFKIYDGYFKQLADKGAITL